MMSTRTSRSRSKRIAAQQQQQQQRSSPTTSISSARSPTAPPASVSGANEGSPAASSAVSGVLGSREVTPAPTSTPKIGSGEPLGLEDEKDGEVGSIARKEGSQTPRPDAGEVAGLGEEALPAEDAKEEAVPEASWSGGDGLAATSEREPTPVAGPSSASDPPPAPAGTEDVAAESSIPVAPATEAIVEEAEVAAEPAVSDEVEPTQSAPVGSVVEAPAIPAETVAADVAEAEAPTAEPSEPQPADISSTEPVPEPIPEPEPLPPTLHDAGPSAIDASVEETAASPSPSLEATQEIPTSFDDPPSTSQLPVSPPAQFVPPGLASIAESLPFALESQQAVAPPAEDSQMTDGNLGFGTDDWEVIGQAEAEGAPVSVPVGSEVEPARDAEVEVPRAALAERDATIDIEPEALSTEAPAPDPAAAAEEATFNVGPAETDVVPMTGAEEEAAAEDAAAKEDAEASTEGLFTGEDESGETSNADVDLFGDALVDSTDPPTRDASVPIPADVAVAEDLDAAAAALSASTDDPRPTDSATAGSSKEHSFHDDADEQANIEAELRRLSDGGWSSPFVMQKSSSAESLSKAAVAPTLPTDASSTTDQQPAAEGLADAASMISAPNLEAPASEVNLAEPSEPTDGQPPTSEVAAAPAADEAEGQGPPTAPLSAQSIASDQKASSQTSWPSPSVSEPSPNEQPPSQDLKQAPTSPPAVEVSAASTAGPVSSQMERQKSTSAGEMPPPLMTAAGVVVKKVVRDGEDQTSEAPATDAPVVTATPAPGEPPKPSSAAPTTPASSAQTPPATAASRPTPTPGPSRPKSHLDPLEIRQRALEFTVSLGPNLSVEVLRTHMAKYGGAIVFGLLTFNQLLLKVYNATQAQPGEEVKSMHQEIQSRMEQNLAWLAAIADAEQRGISPNLSTAKFPDLSAFKALPREAEDQLVETQRRLMYFVECTKLLETRLGDALRRSAQPPPPPLAQNNKRARSETVDSVGSQDSGGASKRPKPAPKGRTQSPANAPARPASRATGKGVGPSAQQSGLLNQGQGPLRPAPPPSRAANATPQQNANPALAAAQFNRGTPPPQPVNNMMANGAMLTPQQQLAMQQRIAASQGMQPGSLQQQVLQQQAMASQAQMARGRATPVQAPQRPPSAASAHSPPTSMGPPAPPQQQINPAQRSMDQYRQMLDHLSSLQAVINSPRFASMPPDQQNNLRNQMQSIATNLHAFQQQFQQHQAAMAQSGQQPGFNQADPSRSATPMSAASPPQTVGTPGAFQRPPSVQNQHQSPSMAHQQINRNPSGGVPPGSMGGQQGPQPPYGPNPMQMQGQNFAGGNGFGAQSQIDMAQRNALQQQLARQQMFQQQQQGGQPNPQGMGQPGMMSGFQGANPQMMLAALQAQQQQQQAQGVGAMMFGGQNQGSQPQAFAGMQTGYPQQQPNDGGAWM